MTPETRSLLENYVYARNALRSAKKEAAGFTSGKRVYNLTAAENREERALKALAGWIEEQARTELGMGPTPNVA